MQAPQIGTRPSFCQLTLNPIKYTISELHNNIKFMHTFNTWNSSFLVLSEALKQTIQYYIQHYTRDAHTRTHTVYFSHFFN